MRKLKLDTLRVESYETSAIPTEVGTVQANAATLGAPLTCFRTCNPTLDASCASGTFCC